MPVHSFIIPVPMHSMLPARTGAVHTSTHTHTHTHTQTHAHKCTRDLDTPSDTHAHMHALAHVHVNPGDRKGRSCLSVRPTPSYACAAVGREGEGEGEGGQEGGRRRRERREAGRRRGNGVSRSLARSLARSLSLARALSLSLSLARSEASLPDHVTTIPTNNVVARALFPPPLLYVPLAVSFSLPPCLPLSLSLPDPPSLVGGTYIKGRRSPIDSRLPRS